MTVGETLRRGAEELAATSETPRLDAELLLAHALGTTRVELYAAFDRELTAAEEEAYAALIERRRAHEPVAYVVGEWGFRRLTLKVDRRALIPRPETEVVVERALARIRDLDAPAVLDVGAGTGAIALAIADEHPGARVTAVDASAGALALARENAQRSGLAIDLRAHDLFRGLPPGPWDLVVSNPPYVAPEERESLPPDVRDWEPPEALFGAGATEAVARGARETLREGGWLVLEVGDGRAPEVAALLERLGFADVAASPDLTGRERVVEGGRP